MIWPGGAGGFRISRCRKCGRLLMFCSFSRRGWLPGNSCCQVSFFSLPLQSFPPFKSSSECQVSPPRLLSSPLTPPASLTPSLQRFHSLKTEGQLVLFLPQSLTRTIRGFARDSINLRGQSAGSSPGPPITPTCSPINAPRPPAVTCVCVCVCLFAHAYVLVFYPCSSSSLNLGQTLLEFRLSSSH